MFKLLEKNKRLKIFTSIFIIFGSVFFFPGEITATPEKPVNASPANGALDQSLTLTLTSSTYANIDAPDETYISSLSPQLWLDASDTSTLFNGVGALPPIGGAVARIEDKSGNNYHFTQSTFNKRPLRQTDSGRDAIYFDGSNDIMTLGTTNLLRNSPGMSIYSVNNKTRGNNTERLMHIRDITSSFRLIWAINGIGEFTMQSRRDDGPTTAASISAGTPNTNEWVINSGIVDYPNTTGTIFKDNDLLNTSTSYGTSGNFSNTTSSASALAGNVSDANFMQMYLGEVLIFNSVHDAETHDEVLRYLNNKWNIFALATHSASQWQITSTSGDYSSPVYDSGEDGTNLESINVPAATLSENTVYYWRVRYKDSEDGWSEWSDETSFETLENVGSLSVGIVDSVDDPVVGPSVSMSLAEFSFTDQAVSGVFGEANEKIRVENGTGTDTWTVSLAPDGGPTSLWEDGSKSYDFNDPTANAQDGADTDSVGGQMTIDPTSATITPQGGCSLTNISSGSSSSFREGVVDSITIATATSGAETNCYWDITGIDISQTIPAEQPAGSYSIDMTLSIIAS